MKRLLFMLPRTLAWIAVTGVVLAALVAGAVWLLLPRLEHYKPGVERLISGYLGQEITIAELDGDWEGFNVILRASGVRVAAGEHPGSAMRFGEMYLSFAPMSLFEKGKTFERLELVGPEIEAARLTDGRIRVGDTILGTPRGTLRRLLQGRNLAITDGVLVWRDALAPEETLRIEDVDIDILTLDDQRQFEFTASPPTGLVERFRGDGRYDPESVGAGTWTAGVNVSVEQLKLDRIPAAIQELLPWESRGRVDTDFRAEWTQGVLTMASADIVAHDFVIPYSRDKTPLSATRFSSSLTWRRSDKEWRLVFTEPEIVLDGTTVSVSLFELERRDDGRVYAARGADVQDLLGVAEKLDIELPWKELIDRLHPRGVFSRAALTLTGPYLDAREWRFEGDFSGLGWRAQERYPGVRGMDGRLVMDENHGELALDSDRLEVDAARSLRQPVGFDHVAASVEWHRWGGDWVVDVGDGEVVNDDLHLTDINFYTRVNPTGDTSPYVLARLRVPRADVGALRKYLPAKKMTDKQVDWLDRALAGGQLTAGRVYLNGSLDAFPFHHGQGDLRVTAQVSGGVLDFHEKWPDLEGLEGDFELENSRFDARVRDGRMMSSPVDHARVWSDDFFRRDRTLFIEGDLAAEADDVVHFLRRGPLIKNPPPAYRTMDATGSGTLELKIELPFTRLKEASRVHGRYTFDRVAVEVADGIEFTEMAGAVDFTENTVEGTGLNGMLFGGPVRADVSTVEPGRPLTFAIAGSGRTDVSRLTPVIGPVMTSRLAGDARWDARFVGGPGPNHLDVNGDLEGVEVMLPDPLWKPPEAPGGIDVRVRFEDDRRYITLNIDERLAGELHYDRQDGMAVLQRGVLNLGGKLELPEHDLSVAVRQRALDMDQWIAEINRMKRYRERVEAPGPERDVLFEHLRTLSIDVDDLRYLHRNLGPVTVRAESGNGRDWTARLAGARLEGTGRLRLDPEPARYEFDMVRLHWPRLEKGERATTYKEPTEPSSFAHLSIAADDFWYGNMHLGTLRFRAGPEQDAWVIDGLSLQQPGLDIEADGRWTVARSGAQRTAVNLVARADNLGMALKQLGLEDQIAGGTADVSAKLGWPGEPGDFDLGVLDGELSFDAEDGRFLKLEPGSGRLLGLFNVETLARRFKLDFTDVFKEGLAFDRINGKAGITSGNLQTDGIFIVSPAALLEMSGSTHLGDETYDLEVVVAPRLGTNLSIASAIANPAAGAMLFVVQQLFRKQMARLIHYKYRVTGDWVDPRVEPVVRQAPGQSPQNGHRP
ncbi:MAG: YhdP family protein [Gammaproteobacteria bacterium]|nr:YhdP family protein [Gammaproteobacteria bacterium]